MSQSTLKCRLFGYIKREARYIPGFRGCRQGKRDHRIFTGPIYRKLDIQPSEGVRLLTGPIRASINDTLPPFRPVIHAIQFPHDKVARRVVKILRLPISLFHEDLLCPCRWAFLFRAASNANHPRENPIFRNS